MSADPHLIENRISGNTVQREKVPEDSRLGEAHVTLPALHAHPGISDHVCNFFEGQSCRKTCSPQTGAKCLQMCLLFDHLIDRMLNLRSAFRRERCAVMDRLPDILAGHGKTRCQKRERNPPGLQLATNAFKGALDVGRLHEFRHDGDPAVHKIYEVIQKNVSFGTRFFGRHALPESVSRGLLLASSRRIPLKMRGGDAILHQLVFQPCLPLHPPVPGRA